MTDARVKVCSKCREAKSLDCFTIKRNARDGLRSTCKVCVSVARRASYRVSGGIHHVRRQNWARYGLSPKDFERLLTEQNGACAICGDPPNAGRALHVDHCHDTGRVRGLLCQGCNQTLGSTRERPDVLRKCADYLERHHEADGRP